MSVATKDKPGSQASPAKSGKVWTYNDLPRLQFGLNNLGDGASEREVGEGDSKKVIKELYRLGDEDDGKKRPLRLIIVINQGMIEDHLKLLQKAVESIRKEVLGDDLDKKIAESDREGQRRLTDKTEVFNKRVADLSEQEIEFKPIRFKRAMLNLDPPVSNPIPTSVLMALRPLISDFDA